MIKVIIVDDELPALKMAESVMKTFDDVVVCGTFSDQDELLESIPTMEVDLILLDMKMPGMHGLELAGRLNEIRSDISIVFVTAYDNYALDAFATDTLDYILKPITEDRVKTTLERYKKRYRDQNVNDKTGRIYVRSFSRFSVESERGEKMKFRTGKTEELLAFLFHHQGYAVSKDRIMEELWYDRDASKAQSILYTTIYQLRKDLENFGLVNVIENSRKEGGVCRLLWSPDYWDYSEYTKLYQQFKNGNVNMENLNRAVNMYQHGYLTDNGYGWAAGKGIEFEIHYFEMMEYVVSSEVRKQRYDLAQRYLKKWLELFPYTESVHMKIIAIYLLQNNQEAAILHYQNTRERFEQDEKMPINIDISQLMSNPYVAFGG